MYDVVTLGETMLRLAPPNFQRLEQTRTYDVTAGGSESSTAVGIARMGLKVAWVSKLPKSPLGRFIANKVREHGVDTSHVVWVDEGRVGVYFLEFGSTPRASQVIYDRKNSAISTLTADDIDWKPIFQGAKLFHTSGITPALSDSCVEATGKAISEARNAGCLVSFDMNYRTKLWSPEHARACLSELLKNVNILVTTRQDVSRVFGITGDEEELARKIKDMFSFDVVAITLRNPISVQTGTWTSLALADKVYKGKVYDLEIIDRVGSGDSFTAGFLYGYLTDGVAKGLAYGDAMASLKHTFPGDLTWVTEEEVIGQIEGEGARIKR
jgi:2-dehydro-3-deoxygluconokinase